MMYIPLFYRKLTRQKRRCLERLRIIMIIITTRSKTPQFNGAPIIIVVSGRNNVQVWDDVGE